MQSLFKQNLRWVRPAVAGLMAALVLVLTVFASSEGLHHKLHDGPAAAHHGPCAVCSVAQGHLEIPAPVVSGLLAALSVSWTLPFLKTAAPLEADFSVASSRGPPASVSSL
jgi:hypothetical protein